MEQRFKTKINPLIILGVWIVSMLILTPVFMFVSNIGASGGEQKPLTTLAKMIVVTIYGAAILSILTAILFRQWFKKNWWYIFIIALTIVPVARDMWDYYSASSYSYSETTKNINGNKITIKTEYYDDAKTIRSTSIWKNDKKDSTWTVYSKDGEIIKQQTFHNDEPVGK